MVGRVWRKLAETVPSPWPACARLVTLCKKTNSCGPWPDIPVIRVLDVSRLVPAFTAPVVVTKAHILNRVSVFLAESSRKLELRNDEQAGRGVVYSLMSQVKTGLSVCRVWFFTLASGFVLKDSGC